MLASDTKSTCNTQTQNQHLTEIQVPQTESLSSKWVKEETIIVFLAAPLLNRKALLYIIRMSYFSEDVK